MEIFTFLLITILIVIWYLKLNEKETYANVVKTFSIYYINVKSSVKRNMEMLSKFKKLDLLYSPQRIEAVTPKDLTNFIGLDQVCSSATVYELACTLSHLKAIYTAYINNDDLALIFEDDIVIHRFPYLDKLVASAPHDWEILQMLTLDVRVYEQDDYWVPHNDANYTAAAYIINRKGMLNVLNTYFKNFNGIDFKNLDLSAFEKMERFNCAADYVIYNAAKTYICNDLFFSVETKDSTIHTMHLIGQSYFQNKIINLFTKNGYRKPELGFI